MKSITTAIKLFVSLIIVTGLLYPLLITGFAQIILPNKANGSMIIINNKKVGSKLIGQQFSSPAFFWGRPSAINNNPMPSGASNLNPVGELLKEKIGPRLDSIRKYHGNLDINKIPKDLIFASASGVDPHISPEAAYFQINRVAAYRNFNDSQKIKLTKLIDSLIEKPDFLIFGEPRINVLALNLKLSEF